MLVSLKKSSDHDVDYIHRRNRLLRGLDNRLGRGLVDRLDLQYLFYPSSLALPVHPWLQEADIVQLYNTHGGYFSHTILPLLSRMRPIVWRLSYMWAFTGHCSYSYDCERWRTGCGACPLLDEYPALKRDTTAFLWKAKRVLYRHSRMNIVVTSRWMAKLVHESRLLGHFPEFNTPNGID